MVVSISTRRVYVTDNRRPCLNCDHAEIAHSKEDGGCAAPRCECESFEAPRPAWSRRVYGSLLDGGAA